MKIGYLGAGTWGTALAIHLAKKGHKVKVWDRESRLLEILRKKREHPNLIGFKIPGNVEFCSTLEEAISDAELIVEGVTSKGIRPVFEQVKKIDPGAVVIMMTGYTAEDLIERAISGGAYTCIYKPFDMEKVISIVEIIAR